MNDTVMFLTIFIPVFVVVLLLASRSKKKVESCAPKPKEKTQRTTKKDNKQKIINLLVTKNKITNNDIEKLLGVSNATAERYLDQLEKSGKIKQVGKTGKHTHYTKK